MVNYHRRSRSSSIWSTKSNLSAGFRYHDGKMINTSPLPSPETGKTYLFEGLIGKIIFYNYLLVKESTKQLFWVFQKIIAIGSHQCR